MPGYKVTTVDPVKAGVVCPHCGLILRDAVQTADGFRLCETCFKEICLEPNCTCPRCGIAVNPTQFWPDRAVHRDIVETLVRCDFHTQGCLWQGKLKHLKEHGQACRYQPVHVQSPNAGFVELLADGVDRCHISIDRLPKLMSLVQQQDGKIERLESTVKRLENQVELQSRAKQQHQGTLGSWEFGESRAFSGVTEARVAQLEKRMGDIERQTATMQLRLSELELQLQASLASTHTGTFLWRIPDIARRRRDAIEERVTSIYSPPFYTGRNGYKMCIRAYLNGDGIGYKTHFSVFCVLMKGEYDPLLKWPFESKVSFILVDQNHRKHIVQTFKPTAECSSFQRPRSDMNVASGCPQFAKLSVLEDESYNKDDVLYIKCIIDTSRIFHP